jgi:glycosyltransferase involved in cell wall biosynthesis
MKITCITPTGDRELVFSLCQRWVKEQTVQPDQWIVVDDGKTPIKCLDRSIKSLQYIRRKPEQSDPKHTLLLNMQKALSVAAGGVIFVLEDDEYYANDYLETMMSHLQDKQAVGIIHSKYYHVSGRYIKNVNTKYASLAQTGFRRELVPTVIDLLKGDTFLDLRIWRHIQAHGGECLFHDRNHSVYVGMKGMPGRFGIGAGHRPHSFYYPDPEYRMLKEWMPDHYQVYIDLIKSGEISV